MKYLLFVTAVALALLSGCNTDGSNTTAPPANMPGTNNNSGGSGGTGGGGGGY